MRISDWSSDVCSSDLSKVDPVGQSSIESWSTALRFFRETHGTSKPGEITRKLVTEWLERMAPRPSRLHSAERNVPLRELVARFAVRRDVARISRTSSNARRVGHVCAR